MSSTTFRNMAHDEQVESFIARADETISPPVSDELMAEMTITYMMRRERFNETGEHVHNCNECGCGHLCYSSACETSADYHGRDVDECINGVGR